MDTGFTWIDGVMAFLIFIMIALIHGKNKYDIKLKSKENKSKF